MTEGIRLGKVKVEGSQTAFTMRCDAVAVSAEKYREGPLMLLSAAGPATAVKALVAALRSKSAYQFKADMPRLYCTGYRWEGGYRVYRQRLDGDYWHVLCVAKAEGFLPVLTEEALWQELTGPRFTTPVLRAWLPWLLQAAKEERLLMELRQAGCSAGWLRMDGANLDRMVSWGLAHGELKIEGAV